MYVILWSYVETEEAQVCSGLKDCHSNGMLGCSIVIHCADAFILICSILPDTRHHDLSERAIIGCDYKQASQRVHGCSRVPCSQHMRQYLLSESLKPLPAMSAGLSGEFDGSRFRLSDRGYCLICWLHGTLLDPPALIATHTLLFLTKIKSLWPTNCLC